MVGSHLPDVVVVVSLVREPAGDTRNQRVYLHLLEDSVAALCALALNSAHQGHPQSG